MSGLFKGFKQRPRDLRVQARQLEANTMLLAGLHVDRVRKMGVVPSLRDVEFKVYSQGGEDGILQYLLTHIPIENRSFIEFGVETYIEANTRFLIMHDDWKGLIIDGGTENIQEIQADKTVYAKHDLTAICSFITRDNVNQLFTSAGFSGDIGILSIDIDGNGSWIWEAIQSVSPRIVICEYNSVFGPEATITIPYDPSFDRGKAHYSYLYFGASLAALCNLADKKGYDFVGSNTMGNNAFFVRKDLHHPIRKLTALDGHVVSTHRMDSRDIHGNLSRIGGSKRLEMIKDMPVVNIQTGTTGPISNFV